MKKAIIIGATSGIGKSLAEILLREGYEVGVTGRREELFQSIKTQETSRIIFKKMDVQDLSTIEPICSELVSQIGGLDLAGGAKAPKIYIPKPVAFHEKNNLIQKNEL